MRWAEGVAYMGEDRKVHRVLVGMPEGKRPLDRPRCRWEDGIRMYLGEIHCGGGGVAQGRDHWRAVVNVVMNLWVLPP
jgi:hypothetical protein